MNTHFVSEKIRVGFSLTNSLEHSYFLLVYISIFRVIKFLNVFLMAKCISIFEALFWRVQVCFIIARQGHAMLKDVYVYNNGYFWWKFYVFIFLWIYMLTLMFRCTTEIKNIELQCRHSIRKHVSSLNSHGLQHFKTDDFGRWAGGKTM